MWAVVSIAKNWRSSSSRKEPKAFKTQNFLSESELAFRPAARMCPRTLMMMRAYHGRVVPATTHRVAEVRSNQKDDTLAHGNSRLFKAVEALRRGKIIALPTVRSGFPCNWKWHSLFSESFLRTRFMGSRQEFALSQVYGSVRQSCLARDE